MRTLTPAMINALTGAQTSEVFIILVAITHTDLGSSPDQTIRFSSDPTTRHTTTPLVYKTVSRGDDYYFIPMAVTLPNDSDGAPSTAQLSISNVGRDLIELLRSVSSPAQVTLELVLASDPDEVGFELPVLDMTSANWDKDTVSLTLTIEALDREPYPAGSFDPASFPALH